MRFKGTMVIAGVVGMMATLGCTGTKKPTSDQKPPEVTFGDQTKGDDVPSQPKAGGVPKRPAPGTQAPAADEKPANDTLELPGAAPAAAAAPSEGAAAPAAADRSAPGADTLAKLREAYAAATD